MKKSLTLISTVLTSTLAFSSPLNFEEIGQQYNEGKSVEQIKKDFPQQIKAHKKNNKDDVSKCFVANDRLLQNAMVVGATLADTPTYYSLLKPKYTGDDKTHNIRNLISGVFFVNTTGLVELGCENLPVANYLGAKATNYKLMSLYLTPRDSAINIDDENRSQQSMNKSQISTILAKLKNNHH